MIICQTKFDNYNIYNTCPNALNIYAFVYFEILNYILNWMYNILSSHRLKYLFVRKSNELHYTHIIHFNTFTFCHDIFIKYLSDFEHKY